ncbi:DUF5071 domain-containing protein [Bacillus cihuensis]|uniref:DUF5071 domain-containing protein n=1 Tax=Bacillus cihuensis TaxID=1208599 RepID=UPI0003FCBEAB|nr:DUF5071 domain-containing protein [Bacillus cihuensis]
MKNINTLIQGLNWHNSEEVQKKSINELSKLSGKEVIILADQTELNHKACWFNSAIVLQNIGYPNNKESIPYLMQWFQDINWPGVSTVVEIFKSIDREELKLHIDNAITQGLNEKDDFWIFGLLFLIDKLHMTHMYDKKPIHKLEQFAGIE